MWFVHNGAVAVDDVRPVEERVALIEGEEFVLDGNTRRAEGRNLGHQRERAAELRVKDRARQVVAASRGSGQKEPTAELVLRLIDCDVRAGHVRVADEKRR